MARRPRQPVLSATQLEIMQVVWSRGEATVAEVWKELSAKRPVARNTVQTLMTRLERKGCLKHRVVGNRFHFSPAKRRAALLRQLMSSIADAAFGGSTSQLVRTLLEGEGVAPDEAERIRKMIDQAVKRDAQ